MSYLSDEFVDENLRNRSRILKENKDINGLDFALIDLIEGEDKATLTLHFFNVNNIIEIDRKINSDGINPNSIFRITGGDRLTVKISDVSKVSDKSLELTITPIGDYSTYKLEIGELYLENFDPLFSVLEFKFRPGCFNTRCRTILELYPEPEEKPIINYLVKDFETFKHTMITAMRERVPGWEPTSEAGLDLVLIELISAAADELSDFQDRVMNEAFFSTARKRVSLARHALLMDYYIFQGNQGSTWIALEIADDQIYTLPKDFQVRTSADLDFPKTETFKTKEEYSVHHLLNKITLYTWENAKPILEIGSTSADLQLINSNQATENDYKDLREFILENNITHLLIQEWKDPETGISHKTANTPRQLLKLILNEEDIEVLKDPVTEEFYLRVHWEYKDKLKYNFHFAVEIEDEENLEKKVVKDISFFHGNLLQVFHGEPRSVEFCDPNTPLPKYLPYSQTKWGIVCTLPHTSLAFKDVYGHHEPNGECYSQSTLEVTVSEDEGEGHEWEEVPSLINFTGNDKVFVVETDELGISSLRFGNGINGELLPEIAKIHCEYQTGVPEDGNVGADKISVVITESFSINRCWNPFSVTNGRRPETPEEIRIRVPEAYRTRQLRAVTVNRLYDDYEKRTEELKDTVSRAVANYRWLGNWRLVQISLDPVGTSTLSRFSDIYEKVLLHLDPVRLINDQTVIKRAKFVSLRIEVPICIDANYSVEDVRSELELEFSRSYTADGREGFFHPNQWTFGQTVLRSQIIGRVQSIKGAHHAIDSKEKSMIIERYFEPSTYSDGELVILPEEVIQVKNDPNQMEQGFIRFNLEGGRQ